MFDADLHLDTERLRLRMARREDFEPYAAMMADAEATRFIGGVMLRGDAWRRFLQMPGAWAVQGHGMFQVVERASGTWLGQLGPWQPDGWPGTEIGWAFRREAWGHGYATEAGRAAIEWAFNVLGWREVIHCITPANTASRSVARRLGSVCRGPGALPPPYANAEVEIWGQTREAWRQRQG